MRTAAALALGLLGLLALAGCGSGTPGAAAPSPDGASTEASAAPGGPGAACTELTALGATITELNTNFDPTTLLDRARAIDAGLHDLDPPAAVATEWASVGAIFDAAVTAADAAGSDRAAQVNALADVLEAQATPEAAGQLDAIAAAIGAECGSGGDGGEASANESCTVLVDPELAALFGASVPTPIGSDLGNGFAECEWDAAGTTVLVSILPAGDFTEDYLDGRHDPVDGLEQGIALPDFVGIGRVSTDGGTVAQVDGGRAYLVAVMTPDESTETALAAAETLARAASARLGD